MVNVIADERAGAADPPEVHALRGSRLYWSPMAPPRRRAHDRTRQPGSTRATHPLQERLSLSDVDPPPSTIYRAGGPFRNWNPFGCLAAKNRRPAALLSSTATESRAFAIAIRTKSGRLLGDSARARLDNRYLPYITPFGRYL